MCAARISHARQLEFAVAIAVGFSAFYLDRPEAKKPISIPT